MLKSTSKEFRTFFLFEFTKELIKNSAPSEIFELENLVQEQEKEEKEEVKKEIRQAKGEKEIKKIILPSLKKPITKRPIQPSRPRTPRILRIPEIRLPPRLQYLRPRPTERHIDLGKINRLIEDPIVRSIECNGPGENIIVKTPSTKTTDIILSKEEIEEIIIKFSEASKIPVSEGVYRVVYGKLIFSAIISDLIGAKFIIRKMSYSNPGLPSQLY